MGSSLRNFMDSLTPYFSLSHLTPIEEQSGQVRFKLPESLNL